MEFEVGKQPRVAIYNNASPQQKPRFPFFVISSAPHSVLFYDEHLWRNTKKSHKRLKYNIFLFNISNADIILKGVLAILRELKSNIR